MFSAVQESQYIFLVHSFSQSHKLLFHISIALRLSTLLPHIVILTWKKMENKKELLQSLPPQRPNYMLWICACVPMFLSNASPSTRSHPLSPIKDIAPAIYPLSLLPRLFSTFYWIIAISILKVLLFLPP